MPDPFSWVEPGALVLMAFYFGVRFRRGLGEGLAFLRDYALIAPAAWLAEDTCIHLYGFYGYSPGWHLFLDEVPVMVAVIWPFVILSARDIANRLYPQRMPARVLLGAAVVVFDAALIEAVATSTGLWHWTQPGPFGVPFIGFFGWGCFAASCIFIMDARGSRLRPLTVFLAPLLTHGLLLVWWWGLFKWVTGPVPDSVYAGAVVVLCALMFPVCLRLRRRLVIPLDEMTARMAAAAYFFALLLMYNPGNTPLMVFAFSFAPPWFALVKWSSGQD